MTAEGLGHAEGRKDGVKQEEAGSRRRGQVLFLNQFSGSAWLRTP